MNCPKCNSEIPSGAKFCVHCGTPVDDAAPVQAEPAQPAEVKQPEPAPAPQPPVYPQRSQAVQQPNAYPLPPSYPRPQNIPPRQGYPVPPAYPQPPQPAPAPKPATDTVPNDQQEAAQNNPYAMPASYPKLGEQKPASAYPPPQYTPVPQPPKKKDNKVFLFVGIGAAAFVVLLILGILLFKFLTGSSVGVIGGADGPTSIFVAEATATPEPTHTPEPVVEVEATVEPTATPTPTAEPTAEPTPTPTPEPVDDPYIFSYISDRKLTESDIAGMTADELMYARNEIYARHGRKFDSAKVRAYFEAQSWYNGTIDPENFNSGVLNSVENYNVEFLLSHQRALEN